MSTRDSSQANGLLCWLRCDGDSGDLLDASPRRNHATSQGSITYQQTGKPKLGRGFGVAPSAAGAVATIPSSDDIYWNTLCPFVSVQVWLNCAMPLASMWGDKHALVYKCSNAGDTYGWYLGVLPGSTIADPTTWVQRTVGGSGVLNAVAFGGAKYVAGGTDGVPYTSTDGVTWVARPTFGFTNIADIVLGGSRFVAVSAVAAAAPAAWSADGVSWNAVAGSRADVGWTSVAYGAGVYVATADVSGSTNCVMTSVDGVTWVARTASFGNRWTAVLYAGGTFVAVSDLTTGVAANRVMTSADGVTWTSRTAPNRAWRALAHGSGTYVAVGDGGAVMTSPDGTTWTDRTGSIARNLKSVAFGSGQFVAASNDGAANAIWSSTDGITWVNRTTPSVAVGDSVFNANQFIAVCAGGVGLTSGQTVGSSSNDIAFRIMDAATTTYTATYTETDFTQFHHYVGTFDGTFVRLYRDSVKVAETAVSGTIGHDTGYLVRIAEGIQGIIDDVAVWNRALTDNEIVQLYGAAGYTGFQTQVRVGDAFLPIGTNTSTYPIGSLYPYTLVIGPFAEAVQVRAGDNIAFVGPVPGESHLVSPLNQWVVDGVDWASPVWVAGSGQTIAAGTVLATLAAYQTLTLGLKNRRNNDTFQGYGPVSVFGIVAAGDGLNIILITPATIAPDAYSTREATAFQLAPGMNDQLSAPLDTVPEPLGIEAVTFDLGGVSSMSDLIDGGTTASLNVFENVWVDPLPSMDSATVDAAYLVTFVGSAGWTNLPNVDLYFQVALSTGMLTIPVSAVWDVFTLGTRTQFTAQFQMLVNMDFVGKSVRFVVEANGPGSSDRALRYFSSGIVMSWAYLPSGAHVWTGPYTIQNLINDSIQTSLMFNGAEVTVILAPFGRIQIAQSNVTNHLRQLERWNRVEVYGGNVRINL